MTPTSTSSRVHETDGDIIVRTAVPSDARLISRYFTRNRAYLKEWEPRREDIFFEEQGWAQRLIKLNELHKMALGFYLLIIHAESGDMLGTISFSNLSRFPLHACNVGYSLDKEQQGKGIMTRAMRLACGYMFRIQNLHRIMASYMPRNKRSEAVLNKLGFQQEGMARDYLLINGHWEDHNLTSLINPDWKAPL